MILLDTHIWVWWIDQNERLTEAHRAYLNTFEEEEGLGVSAISCWEVAMLVEKGKLELPPGVTVDAWMAAAIAGPGVRLLDLSPSVAVASTRLPGDFHRDPADRIITATAREHAVELVTCDHKIIAYPHVDTIDFRE